jgi:hypothetical protein
VLLLLDMHTYGFLIAQIFLGLWLIPLGYLAWARHVPPAARDRLRRGWRELSAGHARAVLVLDVGQRIHNSMAIPPTIAEVWMVGYLLVEGIRSSHQADVVGASSTSTVSEAAVV